MWHTVHGTVYSVASVWNFPIGQMLNTVSVIWNPCTSLMSPCWNPVSMHEVGTAPMVDHRKVTGHKICLLRVWGVKVWRKRNVLLQNRTQYPRGCKSSPNYQIDNKTLPTTRQLHQCNRKIGPGTLVRKCRISSRPIHPRGETLFGSGAPKNVPSGMQARPWQTCNNIGNCRAHRY